MDNNTNQNVNQNVNQTAAPEIKTEEVATNKKEKKPKEKKVKEQKPAMDKEDEKWYALALLFLVISLLPYLSRLMPGYDEYKYADDDKDKDKPQEIITKTLNCRKTVTQPEYTYLIEISGTYENNKPVNTNITYTVTLTAGSSKDVESIEIEEYLTIEAVTEQGVTTNVGEKIKSPEGYDQKVYNANLNFRSNSNLFNRSEIDDHNKDYAIQKENYSQKGYQCSNG